MRDPLYYFKKKQGLKNFYLKYLYTNSYEILFLYKLIFNLDVSNSYVFDYLLFHTLGLEIITDKKSIILKKNKNIYYCMTILYRKKLYMFLTKFLYLYCTKMSYIDFTLIKKKLIQTGLLLFVLRDLSKLFFDLNLEFLKFKDLYLLKIYFFSNVLGGSKAQHLNTFNYYQLNLI